MCNIRSAVRLFDPFPKPGKSFTTHFVFPLIEFAFFFLRRWQWRRRWNSVDASWIIPKHSNDKSVITTYHNILEEFRPIVLAISYYRSCFKINDEYFGTSSVNSSQDARQITEEILPELLGECLSDSNMAKLTYIWFHGDLAILLWYFGGNRYRKAPDTFGFPRKLWMYS